MQTLIKEYIRGVNSQPRGIVVAIRENDEVLYGYSLLNTAMDRFDKTLGLEIALKRAHSKKGYQLPDTQERYEIVMQSLNRIQERALKYFKDLPEDKVKFEVQEDNVVSISV